MKEYKSLPRKIKAVQFTNENKNQVFNELTGNYCADFENNKPIIKVKTMHGEIAVVRIGDWIVEDIEKGTYYPVKDSFFKKNYEEIEK
ncbi:MAG: hypothetical protein GY710_06325 [Desulfobacteraceae bacterium]|nr:hypothetical protein [Desulfobacteraceae bacterium]